ncbi:MAG: hypothetical protein ACRD36_04795, partial [Candidatus Acidiferrum sp.]
MSSPFPADLNVGRLIRLARKELAEILRDRRTILTLILMPLLLYPLMAIAFRQFLVSGAVRAEAPIYRLGFQSEEEANAISKYLEMGIDSLNARGAFKQADGQHRSDARLQPNLETYKTGDAEADVACGAIDVGLRTQPPGPFRIEPARDLTVGLELLYKEDDITSAAAVHYIERCCREANTRFLSLRLHAVQIDQSAEPVQP